MRGRVFSYGFLALATVATTTGFVAHRLLDRPGESAFQFIPENALAAGAFDLVPAPDQVLAFKHIDETIEAANGGKGDTGALLASFFPEAKLKPLIGQVDRSVAMAWLPAPGKSAIEDGDAVGFVSLKNAAAFEESLRGMARKETVDGTTIYWPDAKSMGKIAIMVHDQYAIISDKAWPLIAVANVIRGKAQPITASTAFVAARARALESSNLLLLVSPQLVKSNDWLVGSMSIRETGVDVAVSGQTNDPEVLKIGALKPLGSDVLNALPRGAYGFIAAAQPGSVAALTGSTFDEPQKTMKKEADLDLKTEVLPALGGNVVLGLYPSFGPDAGLDLLVSVDDANGADPATLAAKLEKSLGKEMEKDTKGPWKTTVDAGGTEASRLADEPTSEMQKGIQEMEHSFFRPLTLSKGKTVAWATVRKSVLLATSQDLLTRAVAARRSPSPATSLLGDTALGVSPVATVDGQFALAISMKRFAEGIRNTVDPSHMSAQEAQEYRKSLDLYDRTEEPFAIRANMDASGKYHAFMSTPMDWSKLPGMVK